jgi:hypothetical protein
VHLENFEFLTSISDISDLWKTKSKRPPKEDKKMPLWRLHIGNFQRLLLMTPSRALGVRF